MLKECKLGPESEFLVKKIMSLEGVWYEVNCKVTDISNQTPSKLITFLTKNLPSGLCLTVDKASVLLSLSLVIKYSHF